MACGTQILASQTEASDLKRSVWEDHLSHEKTTWLFRLYKGLDTTFYYKVYYIPLWKSPIKYQRTRIQMLVNGPFRDSGDCTGRWVDGHMEYKGWDQTLQRLRPRKMNPKRPTVDQQNPANHQG